MTPKVEEAVWLIRTMTAAELVELKKILGDPWLPPPEAAGTREPVGPRPGGKEGSAAADPGHSG